MYDESPWRGRKQEQRLYWKVREEPKQIVPEKYERLKPHLEERAKRLWAANEALSFGVGGVRAVAEALQMSSSNTILQGKRELHGERRPNRLVEGRQRRPGGGRKSIVEKQTQLLSALQRIVDPAARGDPMAPLKWTSKSLPHIVEELSRKGYSISSSTVSKLLQDELGYSLQALQKREGSAHPNRDAQFHYINRQCQAFTSSYCRSKMVCMTVWETCLPNHDPAT